MKSACPRCGHKMSSHGRQGCMVLDFDHVASWGKACGCSYGVALACRRCGSLVERLTPKGLCYTCHARIRRHAIQDSRKEGITRMIKGRTGWKEKKE